MIPFPVQQCTGFFCCRGISPSNPSDLPAPSVRETYSRGKLSDFAGNLAAAAKAFPLGAQARAAGEKAGFSLARDTENGRNGLRSAPRCSMIIASESKTNPASPS